MRYSVFLIILISLRCWPQTTPTTQAATHRPCSVANTGSGNKIQINCGIDKYQAQKILVILNKILSERLDPDVVMAKLDEILKAVNPNLPLKTYFCDGNWRTSGPAPDTALEISIGGDDTVFKEMIRLNNSHQYPELLTSCLAQIKSVPSWLTPRLFCGMAYLATGDKAKAKDMLTEFDSKAGTAYAADQCRQMSEFLHRELQYPETRP